MYFLVFSCYFPASALFYLSAFSGMIEIRDSGDSGVSGRQTLPSTFQIKCKYTTN